ncbi:MAG: gamma-glutamyltransferase [Acidobacteria bacterium]|nr:gamma-glutamyltransferase [Acidobacteriota bacterium]MBI3656854.1 gamma-glutamyltransferase [Acidobacteriota bacterium]
MPLNRWPQLCENPAYRNSPVKRAVVLFLAALLLLHAELTFAASRSPVRGKRGMVVSADEYATQVGVSILAKGGNAVDAAVAVGFALAVTHPSAGNIGGGGFMLVRPAKTGETMAIDYREKAPRRATRDMYLDKQGNVVPELSTVGYKAAGVPGTVAGLALALEKYGTMKLSELIQPSINLAEKGIVVRHTLARSLRQSAALLSRFPDSHSLFLRQGRYFEEGNLLVQKDLARTLRTIAQSGPSAFYDGPIAELIVADMERHGGLVTREDLKTYQPRLRPAIKGLYRGYEICSMPPPSSGGIALLEMLNILEPYPLANYGHNSSRTLHLMAEAMRLAFRDRAEFLGDSDFVKVPVAGLIAKKYAAQLRLGIDPYLAAESRKMAPGRPTAYESAETTHYSIVDAAGNAVANTYTLNGSYGGGATVHQAGFLLNNEMDDFSSKPGNPNMFGLVQGEANAIAPNKRPLSAMTPTIVTKENRLFLVTGSPGGPTIINTVLQVLINVIDFKRTLQEAVDAPRIHHQWLPDRLSLERGGFPIDVVDALKGRGHTIEWVDAMGDAHSIMIEAETAVRLGAADPRRNGLALGY